MMVPDADHDGVVAVPQLLHMVASLLAGDPSAARATATERRGMVQVARAEERFCRPGSSPI